MHHQPAPPVYQWRVDPKTGSVRFRGPIGRPRSRWRERDIELERLPAALRELLLRSRPGERAGEHPAQPLRIGRRSVVLIHTGRRAGLIVDHTQADRRHEALGTYARHLEEGIEALPEAFVLYDDKDQLLVANSQYSKLYPTIAARVRPGVTFREITELAVARGQFLFDADPAEWLRKRLEFHQSATGFFEQRLRDGRWIRLSERRTPSGGTASVRTDITLLKEQQRELQRAMQLAESTSLSMSRFLAVLSHEVRNGLNGMLGMAQLLALDATNSDQADKFRLILESTRGLVTVLSDLLDYLRNEAKGVRVSHQPISPRQIVETLRSEFEAAALERAGTLVAAIDPAVPEWVGGDAARIQQVLMNLISNAIKYSNGGQTTIGVAVDGPWLRYRVDDQGVGIAQADLAQLFELFARIGRQEVRGSGLGLAISKQLVTAMRGTIGVQSRPGKGSRFWFDLPLRESAAPKQPADTPTGRRAPRQRQLRVGVIDDDPLNLYVAESFLRRLGHEVFVFHEAVTEHLVEQQSLDALLLDVMMPGESGTEVAARLRSRGNRFESLAIVAITANALPDEASYLEAGFDTFLQKPITIEKLDRVLQRAVSARRSLRDGPQAHARWVDSDAASDAGRDSDPQAALRRLRSDIGAARYSQSTRAAQQLFRTVRTGLADPAAIGQLAPLLHRLQGSAPQLGFEQLGSAARILHEGLQAASAPTADLATAVAALDRALRHALAALDAGP